MDSSRPGDVLADRYRLEDLLSETPAGRFWLAYDEMLERPIAVQVIPGDDPRTPAVLRAARNAAALTDTHLLRILDADAGAARAFVVTEWSAGTPVDQLLAQHGATPPPQAAWIAAEVAACLATGHAAGLPHGRLIPENVLLTADGAVHVIGYSIEAALYGLSAPTIEGDLADLGGLLYSLLTGRWAGPSVSAVPTAPLARGRPLRPRQVRAGVPGVLDDLCFGLLAPHPRPDAAEVAVLLRTYAGDLLDAAPIEMPSPHRRHSLQAPVPAEDTPVPSPRSPSPLEQSVRAFREGDTSGPATQPGIPAFAGQPRPGPPPLPALPVRPLFADEPRRPRYVDHSTGPASPHLDTPEQDAAEDSWVFAPIAPRTAVPESGPPKRSRRRFRLVVGVGITLAILLAAAAAAYRWVGPGSHDSARIPHLAKAVSAVSHPQRVLGTSVVNVDSKTSRAHAVAITEHPELAHYADDGNPATAWHTLTYRHQISSHGLTEGLGLVVDLHGTYAVDTVSVTVPHTTGLAVFVTKKLPSSVPTGSGDDASGTGKVSLDPSGEVGRYVVVWLTSLPHTSAGYVGTVDEVSVTGTPAV